MTQPRRVGELEEEDLLARDVARSSPRSCPRERMWKLSRQTPRRGVVGALARCARRGRTRRRGGPRRAPRRRSAGRARAARSASRCSCSAASVVVVDRVVGDTLEQTSIVVGAERLPSRRTSPRRGAGCAARSPGDRLEVAERLVEVDVQPELGGARGGPRRARAREPIEVVLEDLHAVEARRAAAASSFSSSVPLSADGRDAATSARRAHRATAAVVVARARRSGAASARRSGSTPVNSANASAAWKTAMRAAVERAAAARRAVAQQLGLERAVDDVGHPQLGRAAVAAGTGVPGWAAMPIGVALTRPSAACRRAASSSSGAAATRPPPQRRISAAPAPRRARIDVDDGRAAARRGASSACATAAPAPPAPISTTTRSSARAGQPAAKPRRKPEPSVLCPIAPAVARRRRVDRAERPRRRARARRGARRPPACTDG